jgi:vacuolar protein sorting-associated protein VTA1
MALHGVSKHALMYGSDRATIRKFVVAAQFMEVLRCFEAPNGMRDELEQKQQYARWKAADIAKALKEGRTPVPGPREWSILV